MNPTAKAFSDKVSYEGYTGGLTKREWLIGQIVSGVIEPGAFPYANYAENAIKLADEIIRQLREE